MKKRIIISVAVISILLILFVPIPKGTLKDGGTKIYQSLTYKIVKWNRLIDEDRTYTATKVYWFSEGYKSVDELWDIEEYRSFGYGLYAE